MEKETNVSKPIPDQIIEEVLSVIRKQKDFDDETMTAIEGLWKGGELKRTEKIIMVIRPGSEE